MAYANNIPSLSEMAFRKEMDRLLQKEATNIASAAQAQISAAYTVPTPQSPYQILRSKANHIQLTISELEKDITYQENQLVGKRTQLEQLRKEYAAFDVAANLQSQFLGEGNDP